MVGGLCAGVAAYLGVDVTVVRVVFVLLAILTKGAWLLVYGVLMFVIPYAETSEDHAAAHGRPFTAQELVDQAMRNIADLKSNKNWKRQWRRQQREWHRAWRHATAPHAWSAQSAYASQVWARAPETAASATPMATKPSQRICIVIPPPIFVSSSFDASVKENDAGGPVRRPPVSIVGRGRRDRRSRRCGCSVA